MILIAGKFELKTSSTRAAGGRGRAENNRQFNKHRYFLRNGGSVQFSESNKPKRCVRYCVGRTASAPKSSDAKHYLQQWLEICSALFSLHCCCSSFMNKIFGAFCSLFYTWFAWARSTWQFSSNQIYLVLERLCPNEAHHIETIRPIFGRPACSVNSDRKFKGFALTDCLLSQG